MASIGELRWHVIWSSVYGIVTGSILVPAEVQSPIPGGTEMISGSLESLFVFYIVYMQNILKIQCILHSVSSQFNETANDGLSLLNS